MTKDPIKYWFYQPDPTLQNNLMAFGWECGKGWFPMLTELSDKLDAIFREKYLESMESFEVLQVKEKFGTLRFYVSSAPDEIYELIDEYEKKSGTICETCGKTGTLKESHGWFMTVCEECFNEKR